MVNITDQHQPLSLSIHYVLCARAQKSRGCPQPPQQSYQCRGFLKDTKTPPQSNLSSMSPISLAIRDALQSKALLPQCSCLPLDFPGTENHGRLKAHHTFDLVSFFFHGCFPHLISCRPHPALEVSFREDPS